MNGPQDNVPNLVVATEAVTANEAVSFNMIVAVNPSLRRGRGGGTLLEILDVLKENLWVQSEHTVGKIHCRIISKCLGVRGDEGRTFGLHKSVGNLSHRLRRRVNIYFAHGRCVFVRTPTLCRGELELRILGLQFLYCEELCRSSRQDISRWHANLLHDGEGFRWDTGFGGHASPCRSTIESISEGKARCPAAREKVSQRANDKGLVDTYMVVCESGAAVEF